MILIGTALLLVSTLPVFSFKNFKVPRTYVLPVLLGVGTFAALMVADPWAALAAGGLLYAGHAPVQLAQFPPASRRRRRGPARGCAGLAEKPSPVGRGLGEGPSANTPVQDVRPCRRTRPATQSIPGSTSNQAIRA